jgi:hypothetical protein
MTAGAKKASARIGWLQGFEASKAEQKIAVKASRSATVCRSQVKVDGNVVFVTSSCAKEWVTFAAR